MLFIICFAQSSFSENGNKRAEIPKKEREKINYDKKTAFSRKNKKILYTNRKKCAIITMYNYNILDLRNKQDHNEF